MSFDSLILTFSLQDNGAWIFWAFCAACFFIGVMLVSISRDFSELRSLAQSRGEARDAGVSESEAVDDVILIPLSSTPPRGNHGETSNTSEVQGTHQ